jgi:hypothetical protein
MRAPTIRLKASAAVAGWFARAAGRPTLLTLTAMAALVALATLMSASVVVHGQSAQKPAGKKWSVPRTPDGHPDLQGIFDFSSATPLERPANFAGKAVLTEAEAVEFERQQAERRSAIDDAPLPKGQVGGYNAFWYEFGTRTVPDRRTSLIVDPPDGRLPPLTSDGQARAAVHRRRLQEPGTEGPEERDVSERCLLGYNSGPPIVPGGYNQNVQIVQTREYIVITTEMIHTARIVPLDNRPHAPSSVGGWVGDSRGHWEGDTLVVETTNFNGRVWNQFSGWNWGTTDRMHLVERFTRTDPETVTYEFTVNDPGTWTKPWTAIVPLRLTTDQMFEYACHEGNHGMEGILRGARAEEREALEPPARK